MAAPVTKAPDRIETPRLILRMPTLKDVGAIFSRYAGDPEVTRFMSRHTHQSLEDTKAFLAFSEAQWQSWPAGPYLIESGDPHRLLGGAGFTFETPTVAETGCILAKDAWGFGHATEALGAMESLASALGLH